MVILLFWYLLSESGRYFLSCIQHCLCHVEVFLFLACPFKLVYKVILSYSVF